MRPSQRQPNQLRPIKFTRHFTCHAEGSVLTEFGNTKVLCTASIEDGVPRFLKDSNQGWLTAEYGMLPRSTHTRMDREASRGQQSGRTIEIQRLIGRSLRAAIDLTLINKYTIKIDCDVLQADGGTRTAAISGAYVALVDAVCVMQARGYITANPIKYMIGAISVGIYNGVPVLDLDYAEDSHAHTDMNVIMTNANSFIELQGTAEGQPFSESEFNALLTLAKQGISEIHQLQQAALAS